MLNLILSEENSNETNKNGKGMVTVAGLEREMSGKVSVHLTQPN